MRKRIRRIQVWPREVESEEEYKKNPSLAKRGIDFVVFRCIYMEPGMVTSPT